MPLQHRFVCPLKQGIHARPASHLQELASRFSSSITLINEQNGFVADVRSTLTMMSANVGFQDPCTIVVSGSDEQVAFDEMVRFLEGAFLETDLTPAAPLLDDRSLELPRTILPDECDQISGHFLQGGIGQGKVLRLAEWKVPDEVRATVNSAEDELNRFHHALSFVVAQLHQRAGASIDAIEASFHKTHLAILTDHNFSKMVERLIQEQFCTVGAAILATADYHAKKLEETGNKYLQERMSDLDDVVHQLIDQIYPRKLTENLELLTTPTIVITRSLNPSQLLGFDRTHLKGLILGEVGTTSHVAILARSFGIPSMTGIRESDLRKIQSYNEVIFDADHGLVWGRITDSAKRYFTRKRAKLERLTKHRQQKAAVPCMTADRRAFPIFANVSSAAEAATAFEQGAEGIGLFRTEMLFLDRNSPPSEEEQYDQYCQVIKSAAGAPVTLRTLDIGGDKPVSYLHLAKEENPFLGLRGARMYEGCASLVKTQLRAMLRASTYGPLKVMFPMVGSVEEWRKVRRMAAEVAEELAAERQVNLNKVEFGLMLEVPSTVFCLDELCEDVAFFSIGTNDLQQYFFAVDRGNEKVAHFASAFSPSFLRFLRLAVSTIHQRKRTVGLCGEMGTIRELWPLMVGLPLDNLSLSIPLIAEAKNAISKLDQSECGTILEKAMQAQTSAQVCERLNPVDQASSSVPLLELGLIQIESEAATKAEAIEDLVDCLVENGRTRTTATIEEAIWSRENLYPTSMEHGFAIPHCKSDKMISSSICLLKLKKPVNWLDNEENLVHTVILIAIRPGGDDKLHLRIIAKISRALMQDEFRGKLYNAKTAGEVLGIFQSQLP